MQTTAILYPVFALAGWTLLMLARVAYTRFTSKLRPADFRTGESSAVPARAANANRNYVNLLELPILFYVVCLLLMMLGNVPALAIKLAWLYVGSRCVHSLIHISYNNVVHRFMVFGLSNIALIGLWVLAWQALPTH